MIRKITRQDVQLSVTRSNDRRRSFVFI